MALDCAFKKLYPSCSVVIREVSSNLKFVLKQTLYMSVLSVFAKYASVIFINNPLSNINNVPGTQSLP